MPEAAAIGNRWLVQVYEMQLAHPARRLAVGRNGAWRRLVLALWLGASATHCLTPVDCRATDSSCSPLLYALLSTSSVLTEPVIYTVGFKRISVGDTDWWIKKFDQNGVEDTTNWNKQIDGGSSQGDEAFSCAADSAGNLYVVGHRQDAAQGANWWIKKFSPDGIEDTTNWNKTFDGGSAGGDFAFDVQTDAANNVFVVGRRFQGPTAQDWWIKKYDANGTEDTAAWNITINGPANVTDEAHSVALAADGSVYVVGELEQSVTFQDTHMKKFSAAGLEDVVGWSKTVSGSSSVNDLATGVAVNSAGEVYVAGYQTEAGTSEDWFIRKYAADGTEIVGGWNKLFDGGAMAGQELLRALALDTSGNVFAGGRLNPTSTNDEWTIKKYDPAGVEDPAWNIAYNADISLMLDDVFSLATDARGALYAAGLCSLSTSGENFCVKKYNPDGSEDLANWNKIYDGGVGLNEWARGVCVFNKPLN